MKIQFRGETFDVTHRLGWWTRRLPKWEPEVFDVIDEFAHPGRLFVDVGAWMGPMTLYASRKFRSVWAFEPDDVAYKQLVDHVMQGHLNVSCCKRAAHVKNGSCKMSSPHSKLGTSETNVHGYGSHGFDTTTCFDLNDFLSHLDDVRLLKMDVEGFETVLLPHVADQCRERRIAVVAEIHHPRRWAGTSYDRDALGRLLQNEGVFDPEKFCHVNHHVVLFRA